VLPFQEERDINMRRTSLIILIAAAGLWVAWAAKSVILHPEMTVESGSYDKPMATIGTKPDQAWSGTTTAAGVDNKPQPGKPVSMVGEIVDFSCYLQVGKHGEKHRSCGQKCVQNGNAAGLLTKVGGLYMLMAEEHDPRRDGGVDIRSVAADHMGHIVQVNGTEATVNGYNAIFVQGLNKK
jgi:hypothetical protein